MAIITNGKLCGVEYKDLIEGHYNTPTSVTTIGERVFEYCTVLTSMDLPNSLTTIEMCAFKECTGLTSMTLPDSLTTIGVFAFADCTGLVSMTLPDSLTTIGAYAFRNCTGLTSMTLPDSLTTIGAYAFVNCRQLQVIGINTSDEKSFYRVKGLISPEFQEKVVPYESTQICIQSKKDALDRLNRLKRNPKISPLYGLFQKGVFGKNFPCEVLSIVSQYEEPLNYKTAKKKIEELPWPLNKQGLKDYLKQLDEIVSKSESGHERAQNSLSNTDSSEEKSPSSSGPK